MLSDREGLTVMQEGTAGWVIMAIILLAVVASAALWLGWKDSQEIRLAFNSGTQILPGRSQPAKQDYGSQLESLQQRVAQAEKAASDVQGQFDKVARELQATQDELKKTREEVHRAVENETRQIVALDNEVKGELATKASTNDVKAVSGELGGFRTGLDSTKRDLQMARSEMGTLIAKNHTDIEKLRRLGERDYIEFTVDAKNRPQKVGEITIELRGTNPSRNQYNVALVVDDKRTEERNRAINEPIFFYTHGSQQPLELVVNKIGKNKIVGYLSVPKALQQTATSGGG
jgi:hypothetical protein